MSKPMIDYQIIPGAKEHLWSWRIFRADMPEAKDVHVPQVWRNPETKIYDDTGVKTTGSARTRGRAEGRARRQVAKAVRAYEMLAR